MYYFYWCGLLLFFAMLLACLWFLFFDAENINREDAMFYRRIGVPFFLFFVLLCGKGICDDLRPRLAVDGESLLYYPRWKKARRLSMEEITGRGTSRMVDSTLWSNKLLFGSMGSVAACTVITYWINNEPSITIHSGMKNAARFDSIIQARLKEKETEK